MTKRSAVLVCTLAFLLGVIFLLELKGGGWSVSSVLFPEPQKPMPPLVQPPARTYQGRFSNRPPGQYITPTHGLPERPKETVYVEVGQSTFANATTIQLGQIMQNIFALSVTFAAEHELSLKTRERFRNHTWPTSEKMVWSPYQTEVTCGNKGNLLFKILQENEDVPIHKHLLLNKSLNVPFEDGKIEKIQLAILKHSEELSRVEVREMLTAGGYSGKPIPRNDASEIPEETKDLLNTLSELAQYAAITQLQQQLSEEGESPELLEALSQGCVQFAALTEQLEWPIDRYYKARGLFYAQRLISIYPDNPRGQWSLLYALGLSGFHTAAIEFDKSINTENEKPDWYEPMMAFCHFDEKVMKQYATQENASPIFRLLYVLSFQTEDGDYKNQMVSPFLADHPSCLRLYDVLLENSRLSVTVSLPPIANQQYALRRHEFLQKIPGFTSLPNIPDEFLDELSVEEFQERKYQSFDGLISALREQSDYSERPDLQELSELLVYTDWWFAQCLNKMAFSWGVSSSEVLGDHPQLYAHHYQKENSLLSDPDIPQWTQRNERFIKAMKAQHYLGRFHPSSFPRVEGKLSWQIVGWQRRDVDASFYDALHHCQIYHHIYRDSGYEKLIHETLIVASPQSPMALTYLLENSPNELPLPLDQIRSRYAGSRSVTLALAKEDINSGRFQETIDALNIAKQLHPDFQIYEQLKYATYYQGELSDWVEVYKDYIENTNDLGLDHALAAENIANHYRWYGKFEEAEPYSRMAADTYSAWGLMLEAEQCLSRNRIGQAAVLNHRCMLRYPMNMSTNLLFATRLGKKHLEETIRVIEEYGYLQDPAIKTHHNYDDMIAALILERPEHFKTIGEGHLSYRPNEFLARMFYGLVRYEQDGDRHLQECHRYLDRFNRKHWHLDLLIRMMADKKPLSDEDQQKLEDFLRHNEHPMEADFNRLLVAMALLKCGHEEQALPHLELVASSPQSYLDGPSIASWMLLELGKELPSPRPFVWDEATTINGDWLIKAIELADYSLYQQSLDLTDRILKNSPDFRQAQRFRAICLRKLERHADAEKAYSDYITENPDEAGMRIMLGQLREIQGNYAQAEQDYRDLMVEYNGQGFGEQARLHLALLQACCLDPTRRDPTAAKATLSTDFEPDNQSVSELQLTILAYSSIGENDKAKPHLESLKKLLDKSELAKLKPVFDQIEANTPYTRSEDWWTFEE